MRTKTKSDSFIVQYQQIWSHKNSDSYAATTIVKNPQGPYHYGGHYLTNPLTKSALQHWTSSILRHECDTLPAGKSPAVWRLFLSYIQLSLAIYLTCSFTIMDTSWSLTEAGKYYSLQPASPATKPCLAVIVILRFLQCPQKRNCGNQLIHRCLTDSILLNSFRFIFVQISLPIGLGPISVSLSTDMYSYDHV